MRKIKFKGKRIDNKEWVYGYLYKLPLPNGEVYMILTQDNNHLDNRLEPKYHLAFTLWVDLFVVDPATISQFTGLVDKNGKEIYERDILLWTRKNVHIEGHLLQDFSHKCIVYYDNDKCAFQFRCKLRYGACVGYLDFDDERADESFVEVIGNIHDNPELLEKGGNDESNVY